MLLVAWLLGLFVFVAVPAVAGSDEQLGPQQIGIVVNRTDPLSVEMADYYVERYQLKPDQVLVVSFPAKQDVMGEVELAVLRKQIESYFSSEIQALLLMWARPYRVACLGLTYGVTFGFDREVCKRPDWETPLSPYFNHPTTQPFSDLKIRPSMLFAATNMQQARALTDRGVAAWSSYPRGGAYFLSTSDKARSSRAPLFPPSGFSWRSEITVHNVELDALQHTQDILLYQTGLTRVPYLETLHFLPGALADHLTSFGGVLSGRSSQMSSLSWLEHGATASYGTVTEPRNYPQKFPHPQVLLDHYLKGATALEAYWKSVAWPAQGVFIGNPLAAPFRYSPPAHLP